MSVKDNTWRVYAAVRQYVSAQRESRERNLREFYIARDKNESEYVRIVQIYNEFIREQINYHAGLYEHLTKSLEELSAVEMQTCGIVGCPDTLYAMCESIREFKDRCCSGAHLAKKTAAHLTSKNIGIGVGMHADYIQGIVLGVILYYGEETAAKAIRNLSGCGADSDHALRAVEMAAAQPADKFDLPLAEAMLLLAGPIKTENYGPSTVLELVRRNLKDRKTVRQTQVIRCMLNTVFKQSIFQHKGIRRRQAQILNLKNSLWVQRENLSRMLGQNRDYREFDTEQQKMLMAMLKTAVALSKKYPILIEADK